MKKIISIVILICLVLAGSQMLFITGVSEDENNDPKETRSGSRGNTLYVGSGQTYSGIQAAIDAANSGDTIRVYDGTYLENVIVDKTLSLIGNGTTKTIIDGDGSGDVVLLKSNWVNITGFKIINSGSEDLFPTVDAGIDVDNVDFVTIKNNNCSNNLYGIFNYKSNFTTIENNTCSNNTLDGIYIYLSDNNEIIKNNCNNNDNGIYIQSIPKMRVYSYPSGTGYVYDYGSKYTSATMYYMWSYSYDWRRSWAKINLSKIPDNSIIKNVVFNGYVAYNNSVKRIGVRLLTSDPMTATGSKVYGESGNGTRLCGLSGTTGIKKVNMNSAAVSAVKNALTQDWIGLGFDHESPTSYVYSYGYLRGYSYNQPCLEIEFGNTTSSKQNVIINNNCSNNSNIGIYLGFGNKEVVDNNTCDLNSAGILSRGTANSTIKNNEFNSNRLHGIYLKSSLNNDIYHNDFINNTVQAHDNSANSNRWNLIYPNGGNFWNDWTTPDNYSGSNQNILGSDGFVDNPYQISGSANAKDHYPYTTKGKIIPPTNKYPPIAHAGPDQNVKVNQTVYFDGSISFDADEDPLTYKWDFGDGAGTSWQNSSQTDHKYILPGEYIATLTVFDGLFSDNDTCNINVTKSSGNGLLSFSPLPTITRYEDESPADNAIDLWEYAQDNKIPDNLLNFSVLNNTNIKCGASLDSNRYIDISPAMNWHGSSTVTIQVSNGHKTEVQYLNIYVIPVNDPPFADAGPDQSKKANQNITLNGNGSYDIENDELIYEWTSNIGGKLGIDQIIKINLKAGIHTITLKVSDGKLSDTDTCVVRISNISGNLPPVAIITPVKDALENKTVQLSGANSYDEDGKIVRYIWNFGDGSKEIDSNNSEVEHTWQYAGNYSIKLTVIDNQSAQGYTYYNLLIASATKPNKENNTIPENKENNTLPDDKIDQPNSSIKVKDTDGDNIPDDLDVFPFNASEWKDSDGDGVGDNADAYPNDPKRSMIENKAEKDSFNMFPIIALILVILILIIVKVTITVFRNKNRDSSEEKPKPEDEVYSNVIHEISSNDQMQDTELSDEDLKIMLEHKFLNGKMSPETYNYMKDFIESSNRKL